MPDHKNIFKHLHEAFMSICSVKSPQSVIVHVYTRGSGHCCLQRPPPQRCNAPRFPSFHVRASPFLLFFSLRAYFSCLPPAAWHTISHLSAALVHKIISQCYVAACYAPAYSVARIPSQISKRSP